MQRKSMRDLKALGETARERSQAAQAQQRAKRAAKAQALEKKKVDIDFDGLGGPPEHVANSNDVRAWWREAIGDHYPDVQAIEFREKEVSLAKKLLAEFGAERVEQGIHAFVAGWGDRWAVQQGHKARVPTFVNLWYERQAMMGDGTPQVPQHKPSAGQKVQQAHDKGEYAPNEDAIVTDMGWGMLK